MVQIVNSLFADYLTPATTEEQQTTIQPIAQQTYQDPILQPNDPLLQQAPQPVMVTEQQPVMTEQTQEEEEETTTDIYDPSTIDLDALANLDLSGLEGLNLELDISNMYMPKPTDFGSFFNEYSDFLSSVASGNTSSKVNRNDDIYNNFISSKGDLFFEGTPEEFRASAGLSDVFAVYDNPEGQITSESVQAAYQALIGAASPQEALSQYYGFEFQPAVNEGANYTNAAKYGVDQQTMSEFHSLVEPILQKSIPYIQATQGLNYTDALEYAYLHDPMVNALYQSYGVDLYRQTKDGSTYIFDPIAGQEIRTLEVKDPKFKDFLPAIGVSLLTAGLASALAPTLSSVISGAEAAAAAGGVTTAGSAASSALSSALTTAVRGGSTKDVLLSAALAGGIDWLSNTDAIKGVLDSLENEFGFKWDLAGGEELAASTQPTIDLTELTERIASIGSNDSSNVLVNLVSQAAETAGDVSAEVAQQAASFGLNVPSLLAGIQNVYESTKNKTTPLPADILNSVTIDTTAPTQYSQAEQQARNVLAYAVGSRGEYREDYDYNNDGRVTAADALVALKLGGVSREDLFGYVETIFGSTVDDITASLDSIGDLEEQVTTGQEIIGAITDERDALAGQVTTLEGQLADAQAAADAAVAAGDANAAELQANADAIQEQLNATTAELDNANATITGLETELGTTQETLAATQEQLATTQEERDAAQTAVVDLTGLLDNANTDLETKTAEIETLNSTVETLNTDIEVLTGDLDTANNNIADLKEQLQTAKDTGADNVADLESQLKDAQDNAAGIQESLDAKTTELDDANATIETLNGEVETLNTTVEDLNGQLEAKQGELDTANTRISELETELGTTQETLSTTQEELATTQETLATTEEALQERQDELDTANTTIIDLRNQITDVNSELLSTQSDLTAKQTELDNAIANNLENVGELEAEVADLTSKVDDLSAESEDLQDQLQNAQDELDELKQDYSDLSEERDGLLTTIAGLEGDLAASQAATETAIAEGQAAAEAAGEAGYATGYGEGEDVGFNVGYGAGYGEGGSEGSTAGLGLGSLFGLLGGYGAGQQQGQGVGFALGAGGRGLGGAPTQAKDFTAELNFRPPTAERLQQKQLQDYVGMLLGNMR